MNAILLTLVLAADPFTIKLWQSPEVAMVDGQVRSSLGTAESIWFQGSIWTGCENAKALSIKTDVPAFVAGEIFWVAAWKPSEISALCATHGSSELAREITAEALCDGVKVTATVTAKLRPNCEGEAPKREPLELQSPALIVSPPKRQRSTVHAIATSELPITRVQFSIDGAPPVEGNVSPGHLSATMSLAAGTAPVRLMVRVQLFDGAWIESMPTEIERIDARRFNQQDAERVVWESLWSELGQRIGRPIFSVCDPGVAALLVSSKRVESLTFAGNLYTLKLKGFPTPRLAKCVAQ